MKSATPSAGIVEVVTGDFIRPFVTKRHRVAERRRSGANNSPTWLAAAGPGGPSLERIGALEVDAFMSKSDRLELAAALNTLLASPTFANWRKGATLDFRRSASARRR